MSRTPDFFYREAQRLGYVARSAFKLLQMQKQYKLINPGSSVLDLGCAPGAWLQVACQHLGPIGKGGVVVGIDIKEVNNIGVSFGWRYFSTPSVKRRELNLSINLYVAEGEGSINRGVKTVSADVMNLLREQVRALSPQGFSVRLSDMCSSVSGITSTDAALSTELGMRALDLAVGATALDQMNGNALDKVQNPIAVVLLLESEDVKEFTQICKPLFRKASWLRPKATRSCSREIYLICQGLR
ncbi:Cell division protein FtsJ [Handroanthus impetiginosus]|uniref:rRNA methyltransferase 2, mitochondrial n=1 Tax=Handroanthus impetiginosus TaxID=429701 RepID=A0A2G9G8H0_9LAMI|nr:Cell division protein FtsJ [Handroanthus impetiginosus]